VCFGGHIAGLITDQERVTEDESPGVDETAGLRLRAAAREKRAAVEAGAVCGEQVGVFTPIPKTPWQSPELASADRYIYKYRACVTVIKAALALKHRSKL